MRQVLCEDTRQFVNLVDFDFFASKSRKYNDIGHRLTK